MTPSGGTNGHCYRRGVSSRFSSVVGGVVGLVRRLISVFVVGNTRQTPRSALLFSRCTTFVAWLNGWLQLDPLEGPCLFEAAMPSLFHVLLPEFRQSWSYRAPIILVLRKYKRGCAESNVTCGKRGSGQGSFPSSPTSGSTVSNMSDNLDLDAFLERYRERAKAVRNRPMPPVEGAERVRFRERMQIDFMDFAMIGDAIASVEDGVLTLRIDLRPAT